MLQLKTFISETCTQCQIIVFTPKLQAKASLKVRQLINHLLQLKCCLLTTKTLQSVVFLEKGFI